MFTNVSRPSAVDVLRPFAVGDIFYADTTSTVAKLAIGAAGQVLNVTSSLPAWTSTVILPGLTANRFVSTNSAGALVTPAIISSDQTLTTTGTVASKQSAAAGIKLDADSATGNFTVSLSPSNLTADRRASFPDASVVVSGSASALTSGRVPFVTTGGLLTDSANFTFSGTLLTLGTGVTSGITIAATTGTTLAVSSASNTAQTIAGGLSLDNAGGLSASTAPALRLNGTSPGDTIAVGSSWTTSKFDSQGTVWTSRTIGGAIVLNQGSADRPEISWYRGSRSYPEFSVRQHATNDTGGQIYAGPGTGAPTLIMNMLVTGLSIPVVTASTNGTTGSLVVAGGIGSSGSAHNFAAGSVATSGALITVSKTSTATSGNDWAGLAMTTLSPSGASTQNASGLAGNVTLASGASGVSGTVVGLDGAIDADATANTFANTTALRGTLRKGGANTITVGTAVEAAFSASAAGTVASAHGFYMSSMANSGGATITTAYGLRIANVTVGATNYAIFTNSGLVSIGDTTDSTSITTGSIVSAGGIGVAKRLTLDGGTGKTIKYVNGTANAAVAVTFGAVGPTGSTAGNQLGWVRVDIAGTDRYIPYW